MRSTVAERGKGRLRSLDRFLTVWIFLAMAIGIVAGYAYPDVSNLINSFSVGTTSIPIALGLIWMMYPPLARVRYEDLGKIVSAKGSKTMLTTSLILNWLV